MVRGGGGGYHHHILKRAHLRGEQEEVENILNELEASLDSSGGRQV